MRKTEKESLYDRFHSDSMKIPKKAKYTYPPYIWKWNACEGYWAEYLLDGEYLLKILPNNNNNTNNK